MINIYDYRLLILVLIGFILIKTREIYKERKNFNSLRRERIYYSFILANALKETKILKKASLTTNDVEVLLEAFDKLPEIKSVKTLKKAVQIYKTYVAEHPTVHDDKKIMRQKIIIPLMKKIIELFTIIDPELYRLVEREESMYIKRKVKPRIYIPSILEEIIEVSLSRSEVQKAS